MFLNNKGRGKGRIISPEYRAWKLEAGYILNRQDIEIFDTRVIVAIQLSDKRQGDCDNRIKPVLDLLVSHGIIKSDRKKYLKGVSVEWADGITGCKVIIEKEEEDAKE
jgi:Holliday junction resolvase RusA-like endonuclease